jgi:hypothetical protein
MYHFFRKFFHPEVLKISFYFWNKENIISRPEKNHHWNDFHLLKDIIMNEWKVPCAMEKLSSMIELINERYNQWKNHYKIYNVFIHENCIISFALTFHSVGWEIWKLYQVSPEINNKKKAHNIFEKFSHYCDTKLS